MPVLVAETAVFLNLLRGGGVDGAQLGLDDDIWDGGVFERVAKPKGCLLLTGYYLLDTRGGAIGIEVFDRGGSLGLVGEEDECDVVALVSIFQHQCPYSRPPILEGIRGGNRKAYSLPKDINASGFGHNRRRDLSELSGVDRGLAML